MPIAASVGACWYGGASSSGPPSHTSGPEAATTAAAVSRTRSAAPAISIAAITPSRAPATTW